MKKAGTMRDSFLAGDAGRKPSRLPPIDRTAIAIVKAQREIKRLAAKLNRKVSKGIR